MKKIIASLTLLSLVVMLAGPSFAVAATVSTGLTQDTSGGANPIVKAKWEANVDKYTDDATTAGAQFNPSGQKDVSKTIALCAVVTDPDGLADVINVYADVFYPVGIALGTSHVPLSDQSNAGCGGLMQEDSLTKLSKADGIELFCNKVKNLNNNLPTFNAGYNYAEICAADGELQKETAAVFCGQKDLSYEDPSGEYIVWAIGQDKVGLQGKLANHFDYLPLTAFQTDFTSINYGNVRLNTHKIINGNLTWDTPGVNNASVRNIGNTRLLMSVLQDDMGLGKTDGNWNVQYDARVGSSAPFAVYSPEVTTALDNSLDLSELDEMDFSIDISKFPPTHTGPYTGTMTLTATPDIHLICATQPVAPTIDGIIGTGEWTGCTEIDFASAKGTACVIAYTDYMYVKYEINDTTDDRLGENSVGNDQLGLNINPDSTGLWGKPYGIILQTGTDPAAFTSPIVNPDNSSSGATDGWASEWMNGDSQLPLPAGVETKTLTYTGGPRISEWKLPLSFINPSSGDILQVGGAVDIGDGSSYSYPSTLNWSSPFTTFVDVTVN